MKDIIKIRSNVSDAIELLRCARMNAVHQWMSLPECEAKKLGVCVSIDFAVDRLEEAKNLLLSQSGEQMDHATEAK